MNLEMGLFVQETNSAVTEKKHHADNQNDITKY